MSGTENEKENESSETDPKQAAAADCNIEETIEDLRKEIEVEEKRQAKALRHQYKYKEVFGSIFYSDVPTKAKVLKGIDGAALTQMNLDKTLTLQNLLSKISDNPGD